MLFQVDIPATKVQYYTGKQTNEKQKLKQK